MNKITTNLLDLIGNTPLIKLKHFPKRDSGEILAKLEAYNPGSSVKDRIALGMIETAEKEGKLNPGATIVEPTSGNTGIGLAMVGRQKGYRVILTMPESMSIERRKLLRSLGAELVLTKAKDGMPGAIQEAENLTKEIDGAFMPSQFDNPANAQTHYNTTGPEIWEATNGKIDFFVSGVGTGGTLSGVGKFLKEKNPNIKIVAIEPKESAVISGEPMGPHMIQGIGAGFIPGVLDTTLIDETIQVESKIAIETARELSKKDSIFVGISSGAAGFAAREVASRPENSDKVIVTVFPDTSERYASTLLFEEN